MASSITILLAVDEPDLLDALGFALNHRGYRVIPALTGDRAAEILQRQLPDLAVLDMLLPGQSGFQLTRLVKERSDGRVPVVMMSDHPAPAHRDYAFAAGVNWFLEKWLAPAKLVDAVETLCPPPLPAMRSNPEAAATPV